MEEYVCKLNKFVYALRKSPTQWYKRSDSFMTSHEFKKCAPNNTFHYKNSHDGSMIYLLLYKYGILIYAKDKKEIQKFKDQLKVDMEMKDLGVAKNILRMEIACDKKYTVVNLSQKNYIKRFIIRINMHEVKPITHLLQLISTYHPVYVVLLRLIWLILHMYHTLLLLDP